MNFRPLPETAANEPAAPHGERHDEAADRRGQRGVHSHLSSQATSAIAHAEGAPTVEAVPQMRGATHPRYVGKNQNR